MAEVRVKLTEDKEEVLRKRYMRYISAKRQFQQAQETLDDICVALAGEGYRFNGEDMQLFRQEKDALDTEA